MKVGLSSSLPFAHHAPSRPVASAGEGYDRGNRGYDDALRQAQQYIANQKAELARRVALAEEMKTLTGPQLLTRGPEILRQIPHAEEPRLRLAAATTFFQALAEQPERRPVASLALAVLGDPSELPSTEQPSIVEQSRRQTIPETCAGAPVDLALAALERGDSSPAQVVSLGREMMHSIESRRMQQGFASVRVLANLVARYDPQQEMEATGRVMDFFTSNLGNWDYSRQTEGGNEVMIGLAGSALTTFQDALALKQLYSSPGGPMGEQANHVIVGGVMLRKRGSDR